MLPPYGKVLKSLNPTNDVFLFVGQHAWQKAKNFQLQRPGTLCLPAYLDPFEFEWPVCGYDILVIDTGYCDQDYIETIAACLLSFEANIVRYVSLEGYLTIYKKEF